MVVFGGFVATFKRRLFMEREEKSSGVGVLYSVRIIGTSNTSSLIDG